MLAHLKIGTTSQLLCRTSVRTWCTNVSKKKCYSSLHSFIWARIDPNRLRSAAEYSSIYEGKKKCTLPFLLEWNCMWLLWIYCKRNTSSTVLNWYEIVYKMYLVRRIHGVKSGTCAFCFLSAWVRCGLNRWQTTILCTYLCKCIMPLKIEHSCKSFPTPIHVWGRP